MSDIPVSTSHPELEKLRQQADEYLKGWQRAKADYLNLKKQAERDKEELTRFASAALILEFLPIYDHFKRAMNHVPGDAQQLDWVKGLGHIQGQFQTLFKALGIEEVPTVGHVFDPTLHEAVAKEKREGTAPNTILEELSTGFRLEGKLLAPAKVKVSE